VFNITYVPKYENNQNQVKMNKKVKYIFITNEIINLIFFSVLHFLRYVTIIVESTYINNKIEIKHTKK
jgi:hypothetical protein